jgi:hypothetical protein
MKHKQIRKAHPLLHLINQHPRGQVQARLQERAADPIMEKQERKSSKNKTELFQKQKKMLRSGDATRQRRPEKKKIETTRKLTQVALEKKRKIGRRRRNLADQIVDLRTSISSLIRRQERKSQDSETN